MPEASLPASVLEDSGERAVGKPLLQMVPYLPGMALLLLMLVLPAAYQTVKIALLVLIITQIVLTAWTTGRLHLHRTVGFLFAFYLTVGLMHGVHGVHRGNPGALAITKEVVAYVSIYMILVAGIRSWLTLRLIHATLVVATALLCAYALDQILFAFGLLPEWLHVDLYSGTTGTQSVVVGMLETRGTFGMDLSSFPSFMFLQPYLVAYAMTKRSRYTWLHVALIACSTIIMVLSGKRVLLLIALFSPLVIALVLWFTSRRTGLLRWLVPTYALGGIVAYYAVSMTGYDLWLMMDYVRLAFEPGWNAGVRTLQFRHLMDGWMDNPLLGSGSGAVQWSYVRSEQEPWNYELSYVKYLFDFGAIGFMVYALGIAFLWARSIRLHRTEDRVGVYALATALGSMAFFVGNATNPYLLKFDYLVVVFLPVAIVNLWLLQRRAPAPATN